MVRIIPATPPTVDGRVGRWSHKVEGGAAWTFAYNLDRSRWLHRRAFLATAYKIVAGKGAVVAKVRAFRERWRAKDAAYKWYCARSGRKFRSIHAVPVRTRAQKRAQVENLRARSA